MNQKKIIRLFLFIVTGLILIFNNSCKKAIDTPVEKLAADQVADKDGNIYNTVTIGTQTWMAENLQTTKFSNGDAIPTSTLDISRESAPKYQWAYGNDSTNIGTYGRLYTWYAVVDSRNICPTGWHAPLDSEWAALTSYLGNDSIAGGKLKESGTSHWLPPNKGANNQTGFTALPGGYRTINGEYVGITLSCWLWSASENSSLGWGRCFHNNDVLFIRWGFNKPAGVSVRCIKNS